MKKNRSVLLASISLLSLGGLYYGFVRQNPENASQGMVIDNAKLALNRPTTNAGAANSPLKEKNSGETQESFSADAGIRAASARPPGKKMPQPITPDTHSSPAGLYSPGAADAPVEQAAATSDERQARPPVGIRLAPDVRLPVAAMPNDLKLNPIKQKALQDIVDEYYRTVAAAVSVPESGDQAGTTVVEDNGEETRVISNSPEIDSARLRADLRFKALFGHAAYNRMTMNTLLESRLPQDIPAQ